jgi:taurine dioxygenase
VREDERMELDICPLTGTIGAEIRGVDLREPLGADARDQIENALLEHLVVFFRDQSLTDEQHRDFAAQFGPLDSFVLAPSANDEVPEMHMLEFDDGAHAVGSMTDSWHTDGTFMAEPPMGTVLRAVELPPYGGDTCWANMYCVYESLSPAMQEMLEGLVAVHDFMKVTFTTFDDMPDPEAELRKVRTKYPVMTHPVVRTHPVTKRKLLYVNRNYTMRIDGLTGAENEVLVPFLFDRVKDPAFQVRFHWEPGSVAFWDNRATQHYAVPDYPGKRRMHRIVIRGDRPI